MSEADDAVDIPVSVEARKSQSRRVLAEQFAEQYSFNPAWIPIIIDIAIVLYKHCQEDGSESREAVVGDSPRVIRRIRHFAIVIAVRKRLSRREWLDEGRDLVYAIEDMIENHPEQVAEIIESI